MKTTERKYWVNGWQVRGNGFGWRKHYCLTFSLFNIGVLISSNPSLEVFKLI